jgi:hypothetical protein
MINEHTPHYLMIGGGGAMAGYGVMKSMKNPNVNTVAYSFLIAAGFGVSMYGAILHRRATA